MQRLCTSKIYEKRICKYLPRVSYHFENRISNHMFLMVIWEKSTQGFKNIRIQLIFLNARRGSDFSQNHTKNVFDY